MRENVSSCTVQSRILALFLVFAMMIGVCPAALATGESKVSVGNNLSAKIIGTDNKEAIPTGQSFGVSVEANFNADETNGIEDPELRLYIGNMEYTSLTSLINGGKISGVDSYIADGFKYTVCRDDTLDQNYIRIEKYDAATKSVIPWKGGDTFSTTLAAEFDRDVSNGSSWTVKAGVYNKNTQQLIKESDSDTAKAYSDVVMNNTKTVNPESVMLPKISGTATNLNKDIEYVISSFTGDSLSSSRVMANGEAKVLEYTVIDTLTLPDGLYIEGSTEADIRNVITVSEIGDYEIENIISSNNQITGFTIKHTEKNTSDQQIKDLSGKIKLNGSKIKVSENFENAKIKNEITTEYKTVNNPVEPAKTSTATVETNVYRPKDASCTEVNKNISEYKCYYDTQQWNDQYFVQGDYVIYKLSFKNSGQVEYTGGTVTDTLPNGLEIATNIPDDIFGYHYDTNNERKNNGVCIHNATGDININGNTVTINNINVSAGATFEAYIVAKIKDEVSEITTRLNTATICGNESSVSFVQKPKKANISIQKSAYDNTLSSGSLYRAGDSITYTITVTNNGTGDAKDVNVTDLFPAAVFDDGITFTVDGNSSTPTATENKNGTTVTSRSYDFGKIDIPAKGSKIITITGKVKSGIEDSSIVNNAYAEYDNSKVEANAVLKLDRPETHVTMTKTGDKDGQYVKVGDIINYTITVNTNGEIFTDEAPIEVRDVIPNGLTVNESDITYSSGAWTFEHNGQTYTFKGVGEGIMTITIPCTVNESIEANKEIKNTSYIIKGASSGSTSGSFIVGEANKFQVEKTAEIYRDNQKVGDIASGGTGNIKIGDILKFKIKVTNNSGQDVTNLTLHDEINGYYEWVESVNSNSIKGTVQGSEKVKGIDNNNNTGGNYFSIIATWTRINEDPWNAITGVEDITFSNVSGASWYNDNFIFPNGETIEVSYELKTIGKECFKDGSNAAWIGNDAPSKVFYTTETTEPTGNPDITPEPTATPDPATLAELKIEKTLRKTSDNTEKNYTEWMASKNAKFDPNNYFNRFYYVIKVTNTSDKTYTADDAVIIDQLPDDLGIIWDRSGKPYIKSDTSSGAQAIEVIKYATIPKDGDYRNDEYWKTYDEAKAESSQEYQNLKMLQQNWVSIKLKRWNSSDGSTYELKPGESIEIALDVFLRPEVIKQLESEVETNKTADVSRDFEFKERKFSNIAYFTGDKIFKNTDGKLTKVIAASHTAVYRSESIRPGVQKTAFAYMEQSKSSIEYKSTGAKPGARLIWKLRITNDKDSNGNGDVMEKYTLTDILPNGYKYIEDQRYENSADTKQYYPESLSGIAENYKAGNMIKYDENGNIAATIDFIAPTIDGNKLIWEFDGTNYSTWDLRLEKGQSLEFLIITEPILGDDEQYKSGVYYNKAVLEVNDNFYEDTVKVGTIEDGKVVDGDSFSINKVLTSASISVSTSKGTAEGGTDQNVVEAAEKEKVRYTLRINNDESASGGPIKNISIINRLPYVGDGGVIVSGQRGSEFDVKYSANMSIKIYNKDGTLKKELKDSDYTFTTYSGDVTKEFDEKSEDWNNLKAEGWSNTWDSSTKLVRIIIGNDNNPIELSNGEYIEVSYDAILPDQGSTEDTTAWNGFAYHYDAADGNVKDMAAEPASVGVTLPKNDTLTGKISVKKTLSSPDNTPRTFYVAIYDKQYEKGVQPLSVKSITLTGGSVKHPVNAEIEFDDLTYIDIGKEVKYYIYETDENGVPLIQDKSKNGFVMCKGFYRTDKGSYSVVYNSDTTNKVDKVTPSDAKNVDKVWATDDTGANKVEHVITGHYCFWEKGLNTSKRTNSANFTNCIEETQVERQLSVKGPYYSDIATSFEALSNRNSGDAEDNLTTGVVSGRTDSGIEREERDNNTDADRNITYSYDSGNKITKSQQYDFGNGWGNAEGHTVATGFMATITGGTNDTENTINEVMWDVKSDPINNPTGVYVKLDGNEYDNFNSSIAQKGYSLTPVFTDDKNAHNSIIYRIEKGTGTGSLTDAADAVDMDNSADDEIPDSFGDDVDTKLNENGDSIGFDSDDEVSDSFGNDDYSNLAESEDVKPLHWKITDKIPAVTLGNGTTVNIGIIIDQIYDNSAVGEFTINPSDEDSASATSADSAKITPYGPQSDVPAYNFSGIYAAEGIKNVLSPLKEDDNIALGKSYFGFKGDIRSIRANTGDKKQVMICAGAYQESNSSGKLTYKNDVTVNDEYVRVGSYNNSKSSYLVSGQPAPAIAVKIPAGGVKLTINAKSGGSDTRYLTIYESNGNGGFKDISEIKREENDKKITNLKVSNAYEDCSINISADSDKVVYITSTGSNINIKSIGVSSIN